MPNFKLPSFPPHLPLSEIPQQVEQVSEGESDLPSYIAEILKDFLRVLAIRATHVPSFPELLCLLQSYTHRVAHKLRAGPQNRKALFVALGTVPRQRDRRREKRFRCYWDLELSFLGTVQKSRT